MSGTHEFGIRNYAEAPGHYEQDQNWANKGSGVAADRRTLVSPNRISINIDDEGYFLETQQELDLNDSGSWDTTAPTDYTVAANRAGVDFYIYACQPVSGMTPVILVSDSSTFPSGYTADNSRKIGGFHCLCVAAGDIAGAKTARANLTVYALDIVRRPAVANSRYYRCVVGGTSAAAEPAAFTLDSTVTGTLVIDGTVTWRCEGHDLNNYAQGDILPVSVWNLRHRPVASPEGMFFDEAINNWVFIYLQSGTGASTASVFGGTITDTRTWLDFVDDGHAIKCRLPTDEEFQSIAAGSNEETNIAGSADPVTTGGHSDTAGRRMISNIGCEDCCGAVYQLLETPSAKLDDGTAVGWYDLPGAKGGFYTYGDNKYGNTQLHAGGAWDIAANCGSRSRGASSYRWRALVSHGARFVSEPKEVML